MSPRSGFLGVLVPDETTRRAFEETFADWRDEWTRAATPIERLRVSTRGWISVARLVALAICAGLGNSTTWAAFSMTLFATAGLSLLWVSWDRAPGQLPLSAGHFAVGAVLLVPQGFAFLMAPAAAIGLGTKRGHEPSVITVALMLFVTMVLLVGWVFPASNQMYREYVYSSLSGRTGVLTRGVPELNAPELIRQVRTGSVGERRAGISALSNRLALVVSAPVFFIFGVAVRRRLSVRRRWGNARFVAGASAIAVFLTCSFALSKIRSMWPVLAEQLSASRGLSIWLSSIVLCLAIGVLARSSNQTSEPGTEEPGT